ncbi:TetR/AcrR family transcriptional regulator [Tissierella sp.]|uniref:TetR/AcrR family transcriptional regulator n=1 Tax=Tissierella sp. TaxID=41274 RepID=UPI002865B2E0|nr:TetR/AcrR family transcriptional regulator [Tissierella sp.]MDR7857033.1 TetR/AcrR family transcriptional regulator [Tissierella sp.]
MENKESRKRMSKEDRKEQIIESALKVFVEKGYNGTTTQEIAKAADITEVTLFRHFSSKQEIFMEGIEPIIFTTLKESVVASKDLSPREQLEYILRERISLISKNYKVIRLILMESKITGELNDLNFIGRIAELLKTTITDMGFAMRDEEFTLRILMGGILSFLFMPEADEDKIKDFVSHIIPIIINSLINLEI